MGKTIFFYKYVLVFILILCISNLFSQTDISSPYSRYGLGQIHQNYSVKSFSMGGMSIAHRTNDLINISNPASYSGYDTTSFVFEGGINGVFCQLKNKNNIVNTSNLSLNYLLFGFPLSKKIAFTFGLLPYSNMSYNVSDSNSIADIGDVNYYYKGEGGFNKFFGGASYKITKALSIGANMSYLFGSLNKTRTITFPEGVNLYSIRESRATKVSDIIFDYGLLYEMSLKNENALCFGFITGLSTKLNASENKLTESFSGINYGSIYIKDTIENYNSKGVLIIPPFYGGGVMYKKSNKWILGADFKYQEWSKFSSFGTFDSLKNSMQGAIGFSILPSNTANNSFWRKSTYRFGLRASQTYLQLKSTQLNDYGISFGFAFPMQKSKSTINLGFEIGQRGTDENSLIKETYGIISFSLSIYERWFLRKKYE